MTPFLDAAPHLYKRSCPSVCRLVRWSVRRSVCNPFFFFKENDLKWQEIIRKFSAKHKSGQNQSTPPIKTSISVKMSNCSRIVVLLRDLFKYIHTSVKKAVSVSHSLVCWYVIHSYSSENFTINHHSASMELPILTTATSSSSSSSSSYSSSSSSSSSSSFIPYQ